METQVLDRRSVAAREIAKTPVGKTFVNADAVEEARQMGARWVRVAAWGGEGRGAYGILELPNWLIYDDGTDDLSEMRLAIVVTDVQDLGREPWIEYGDAKHYIGRYQFSGMVYWLRDTDLESDRNMPAGAVPLEQVLTLPILVFISGLAHRDKTVRTDCPYVTPRLALKSSVFLTRPRRFRVVATSSATT